MSGFVYLSGEMVEAVEITRERRSNGAKAEVVFAVVGIEPDLGR